LNHFTVPCSAMLVNVPFVGSILRWRDSEVLLAGYWLLRQELLTSDSV
jgi:hypothetical protein